MIDKISALNNRIRMNFVSKKKPLSIRFVQELTADLYPSHDILSVALSDLKTRGLIKIENDLILPIDNEGIIRDLEGDDSHVVKKESIIRCLNLIGSGTPSQISSLYLKFEDSKANVESITRKLRLMFADGEVKREGEIYSTTTKPMQTLNNY